MVFIDLLNFFDASLLFQLSFTDEEVKENLLATINAVRSHTPFNVSPGNYQEFYQDFYEF